MSDPITPNELARELGVSAKTIRAFLRSQYGPLRRPFETRWKLSAEQVAAVRARFAG